MAEFLRVDREKGKVVSENRKAAADDGQQTNIAEQDSSPDLNRVRNLAAEHPFALILGSLALGAVAGALLPRSAGRKLSKGAVTAASMAGKLGLIYARQAMEKAEDAAESLAELKETVGTGAADYSRKAADLVSETGRKASNMAEDTLASARNVGQRIGKQAIKLRSHIRH